MRVFLLVCCIVGVCSGGIAWVLANHWSWNPFNTNVRRENVGYYVDFDIDIYGRIIVGTRSQQPRTNQDVIVVQYAVYRHSSTGTEERFVQLLRQFDSAGALGLITREVRNPANGQFCAQTLILRGTDNANRYYMVSIDGRTIKGFEGNYMQNADGSPPGSDWRWEVSVGNGKIIEYSTIVDLDPSKAGKLSGLGAQVVQYDSAGRLLDKDKWDRFSFQAPEVVTYDELYAELRRIDVKFVPARVRTNWSWR